MDFVAQNSADYFVTAHQIFDYCGADSTRILKVNVLMDKFAPFVKTNKAEFTQLRCLLDPEECNPDINVDNLAEALSKYSESQKVKGDLEESFNFKSGQAPQDSDSGVSTDGFQLLEELQSELREKTHIAHKLRSQLDFTDRQHEEAVATLTAERDSLRGHLTMLREENQTLCHVRRDYEDACERLCDSEHALSDARRELDAARKRQRVLHEQVAVLESDKLTLQELLTKSKDECHRINEMYASRQSALLEENETLKTEHADLTARLQDQEDFLQQLMKEKLVIEMELKDVLNKSNQTHLRLDRSIDVSYTEDQMLSALDSLHPDKFSEDNKILDEESFMNALKEDVGRSTNISLFDEIRYSFHMSRHIDPQQDSQVEETKSVAIQTDVEASINNNNEDSCQECKIKCKECESLKICGTKLRETLSETHNEMTKYEENLNLLQNLLSKGNKRNEALQSVVCALECKLQELECSCDKQSAIIVGLARSCETICTECQTDLDYASVSTQVEQPCLECVKRNAATSQKGLVRRYLWDGAWWCVQLLALLCLAAALLALYAVHAQRYQRCDTQQVPWRWLDTQDLMDLLFRMEYVSEVPM